MNLSEAFLASEKDEQIANDILNKFFEILKTDTSNLLNLTFYECYSAVVNKRLNELDYDYTKKFSSSFDWRRVLLRQKFNIQSYSKLEFLNTDTNYLLEQFANGQTSFHPAPNHISLNKKATKNEQKLCSDILDCAEIPKKYGDEILRIFKYAEVCKNLYGKIPFSKYKTLLTGTGSKVYNRVSSDIALNNHLDVYRFSHGGDRGFFNDKVFEFTEYSLCTKYFVHGLHEQNSLDKIKKIKKPKIVNLQSQKHSKFKSSQTKLEKIIYVSNSFTYPRNSYPNMRPKDKLYKRMQKSFLCSLENTGFPVLIKLHPKGNQVVAEYLNKYGFVHGSLSDHFGEGNIFAFDVLTSAMVEALSAGECVILWDTGIRHKSEYFETLRPYAYIIEGRRPHIEGSDIKDFFQSNSSGRREYSKGFYE